MLSNNTLVSILFLFSITVLLILFTVPKRSSSQYFQPENFFIPNDKKFSDSYYDTDININLYNISGFKIAIGCAITSHTSHHHTITIQNLAHTMPFLRTLVPSFCKTASAHFFYTFYVSYDIYDPCFSKNEYMQAIQNSFNNIVYTTCPSNANVSLLFIRCHHNNHPAWAQNDAMMQAYIDHHDYYYRVNDDTRMLTQGWTEIFINTQLSYKPPNVGVVGPFHKGGNEAILTYDFVHRTHVDIFGSYYPRVFTDWWADNWISEVYGPQRTTKIPSVRLVHTGEMGTRYSITKNKDKSLDMQVDRSETILKRYLKALKDNKNMKKPQKKRVISISLWGGKPKYVFGAMRNANLLKVYFPKWTLRVYTEKANSQGFTRFQALEQRHITKLKELGAEVVMVDYEETSVPPLMWRFLVADDLTVSAFIVRDADSRLDEREASVVKDWLNHTSSAIHCIRDHPHQVAISMLGGLWGGRPKKIKQIFKETLENMMMGLRSDFTEDSKFLSEKIWPLVQNSIYCHDSVSCTTWNNSHPFHINRIGSQHIGQMFDPFDNVNENDVHILSESPINEKCTIVK